MRNLFSRWQLWWSSLHEQNADVIERIPESWTRWAIVLASGLALYVEMVMIRWHATSSHAFAIFKNVSLLSCFLGLGIGYALASQRRNISMAAFLPLLAVQTLLFSLIGTTIGGLRVNPVAEQVVMGMPASQWNWGHAILGNAFLAAIFLLNAVMFVPLGYMTGRLMKRLPNTQSYSLNLVGSLLGIGLFFVLSLVWTPPSVWLGVAVLLALPFLAGNPRMAFAGITSVVVILLAVGALGRFEERRYYSPYQTITLRLPKAGGVLPSCTVKVNHAFYQEILDCSPEAAAKVDNNAKGAAYYNLPYRLRPKPGDVLVVGAGTGNDVAAALRNQAHTVTAVEIDPAILYVGKKLHPEGPYQNARTNVVLNDARSYLRQTDARFDTIIYGLLDSHTNMGAMTNVRLDSFVYTVEGFQDAVAALKSTGLLVVTYELLYQGHADKLFAMLEKAYPDGRPRVFSSPKGLTFVTGPGLAELPAVIPGVDELTSKFKNNVAGIDLPTDDWPYFYMQERTYPITYAGMILLLLVLSGWMVKRNLGTIRVANARSGVFFFLGAGFMLVETKVITELGLVFGNTWWVSAVTVTGILVMAYLANLWISRRGPAQPVLGFALLGAALVVGLIVTRLSMVGIGLPLPKLLLPILLTLPLFFAGLLFSSELTKNGAIGEALAANLFGAMLGGFLEYNSMYWGLSSLYILGIGLYGLAFVCTRFVKAEIATVATPDETPAITKQAA